MVIFLKCQSTSFLVVRMWFSKSFSGRLNRWSHWWFFGMLLCWISCQTLLWRGHPYLEQSKLSKVVVACDPRYISWSSLKEVLHSPEINHVVPMCNRGLCHSLDVCVAYVLLSWKFVKKTLSGQVSDWVQIDAHVKNPFRSGPPPIVETSQNPFTS